MANPYSLRDADIPWRLTQKMNQTLSNGIVHLLRIIMSPMSKQDQQREALSSLRSNPGLLLALLKVGLDNVPADNLARLVLSKSEQRTNRSRDSSTESSAEISSQSSTYSDESTTATKLDSNVHGEGSVSSPGDQMSYQHKGTNTEYDIQKKSSSSNTRSKLKRKRKTKDGGQTHKERTDLPSGKTPKIQRHSDATTENGECLSQKSETDSPVLKDNQDGKSEKLVVKKLTEILMNPPTMHHQQTVLAVLRSDEKLRNLFFKEKEILSKIKIPVFRNSAQEKNTDQAVLQNTVDSTSQTTMRMLENHIVSIPEGSDLPSGNSDDLDTITESGEAYSSSNLQQSSSDVSGLPASEEVVFDSALHDHFMDLSQELHLMNNIQFVGGHLVGFTIPTAEHDATSSPQTIFVSESDSKELVTAEATSNENIDFMQCL